MSFPITVVGATGRMGAMLCEAWRKTGTVFAVDRRPGPDGALVLHVADLEKSVPHSGLVLLSAPAPAMPEVADAVAPFMREGQILADVCSVKINPMRAMQTAFPGPVVGTHPFFGPENERNGARVALVRGEKADEAHLDFMAGLFRGMGCAVFVTGAEEHDRACALSQSLHFALAAAYFAAVSKENNLEPYLTPSFMRYMRAAQSELTVNAPMFAEFTENNPLFPAVLDETLRRLEKAGKEGLAPLAEEARAWYAQHERLSITSR